MPHGIYFSFLIQLFCKESVFCINILISKVLQMGPSYSIPRIP